VAKQNASAAISFDSSINHYLLFSWFDLQENQWDEVRATFLISLPLFFLQFCL